MGAANSSRLDRAPADRQTAHSPPKISELDYAQAAAEDADNPAIDFGANKKGGLFPRLEPCFGVTAVALFINGLATFALVYGLTGRRRCAQASLLVSVPVTAYLWLRDADEDFERWESMRGLREKRVPNRMMPAVVKYDWTEFEDRMLERRAKHKLREMGLAGNVQDDSYTG